MTNTFKTGDYVGRKAKNYSSAYTIGTDTFEVAAVDFYGNVTDPNGQIHFAENLETRLPPVPEAPEPSTASFEPTPLNEAIRIYFYPDDQEVIFHDVTSLHVSESGAHRLTTEQNGHLLLHYVAPGWRVISIDNRGKGWNL